MSNFKLYFFIWHFSYRVQLKVPHNKDRKHKQQRENKIKTKPNPPKPTNTETHKHLHTLTLLTLTCNAHHNKINNILMSHKLLLVNIYVEDTI